jgi:hypothetical protein
MNGLFLCLYLTIGGHKVFNAIYFSESKIRFEYENQINQEYDLLKSDKYEFFEMKSFGKIYLNPDIEPKVEDIEKRIVNDVKWPNINPATQPIIHLFAIISMEGEIIEIGFKKESTEEYFNNQVLDIIKLLEIKIEPAIIGKTPVNSLVFVNIEFY